MIEIKCNDEQKEKIIKAIIKCEDLCVCEVNGRGFRCNEYMNCIDCIRENIKWIPDSEV